MGALEEIVSAVLSGDEDAWPHLQAEIAPRIEAIARGHESMRARGMHFSDDDIAELLTATLERLARDKFRSLRRYSELQSSAGSGPNAAVPRSFDSWLYGTTDFAVREHLRNRYGRAPRVVSRPPDAPHPSKRAVNTHAGRFDEATPDRSFARTLGITDRLTADRIFAHIDQAFSARDALAMRMYYAGDSSFEQIAAALDLPDAQAADKLVRKLNARLRYKFAVSDHR